MIIEFHLMLKAENAVAVGSSAVLGRRKISSMTGSPTSANVDGSGTGVKVNEAPKPPVVPT
jgi:hypothetical protein